MKPRGISFAIESITNFDKVFRENTRSQVGEELLSQEKKDEIYSRLERVVLTKIDEFIPHYLVKVLASFAEANQGSGELYD